MLDPIAERRSQTAELLDSRIARNAQAQQHDLVAWIFERLPVDEGCQVLELCAGTGGQTQHLLDAVGPRGRVVAVDISAQALQTLQSRTPRQTQNRLTTVQGGLDDLSQTLRRVPDPPRDGFDLVFCAYGLYYAKQPTVALDQVLEWLQPDGRIAVVGPFGPNNEPLFALLQDCGVTISDYVRYTSQSFMEGVLVPWSARRFASVKISTLENPVCWTSKHDVLAYWSSSTFYDQARRERVDDALTRHFDGQTAFVNKKWVMMIEMTNGRS